MNQQVNNTLDFTLEEVNYPMQLDIAEGVKRERSQRKVSRQVMLESLFDNETGETHEYSDELMQLVLDEYKVEMLEVSSGNGKANNAYNDDTGEFDYYLSASTSEQSQHAQIGLEAGLIDSSDGILNKNFDIIPSFEIVDNGEAYERTDNYAHMVEINNSSYSLWDTIAEKCALIVRHSGVWKKQRFTRDEWTKYSKLRATKRHNRLLGLHSTLTGNDTLKKVAVRSLNKDKKGNKELTRLATMARRGKQWAKDELARIGYNEFA